MKIIIYIILMILALSAEGQNRFPKPDFESGYSYPEEHLEMGNEALWTVIDITMLIVLMSAVAFFVIKRNSRTPIIAISLFSVIYFGFFRDGCVCSIGSLQNIAIAATDASYAIPLTVLAFFFLPIIFTLLFGRVFCAGVCPFGALQDLVNIKNYKLSKSLTALLSIVPWVYLCFALMFAITKTGFLICRFDPFIGIFRMGGEYALIVIGVLLLLASVFTGRPYCRFICPYGAILSLFSRVAFFHTKITKKQCINCDLCANACPVDAILPPYENKVKESRRKGVTRVITYSLTIPLFMAIGALALNKASDSIASVNKHVKMYELIKAHEQTPEMVEPIEVQSFFASDNTIEELEQQVATIKAQMRDLTIVFGSIIGLVVALTLLSLSIKRSRSSYTIDNSNCVSCGRCFSYCPQNKKSI